MHVVIAGGRTGGPMGHNAVSRCRAAQPEMQAFERSCARVFRREIPGYLLVGTSGCVDGNGRIRSTSSGSTSPWLDRQIMAVRSAGLANGIHHELSVPIAAVGTAEHVQVAVVVRIEPARLNTSGCAVAVRAAAQAESAC